MWRQVVKSEGFRVVVGLSAFAVGVAADYYISRRYHDAFPTSQGRPYRVDFSSLGKKGAFVHALPKITEQHLTVFFPRNGSIVYAREVPEYPDWLQMCNGQFIQRRVCGVETICELDARGAAATSKPLTP